MSVESAESGEHPPESGEARLKAAEGRLDELEADLLSQEHRTLKVLTNFFCGGNNPKLKRNTPAVRTAFIYMLAGVFMPPAQSGGSTSSFSLTLLTVATLVVTVWASCISQRQNREARLSATFASRMDEIERTLAKLPEGKEIPSELRIEIVNWSRSLTPYEVNGWSGVKLSPERGRLVRALADSRAHKGDIFEHAIFQQAALEGARLKGAELNGAFLEKANLDGAILTGAGLHTAYLQGASLRKSQLDGAILEDANLDRAILDGADLRKAILTTPHLFKADFSGAMLDQAVVHRLDWLEWTKTKKVRGLNRDEWRVVPTSKRDEFRIMPAQPPSP